MTPGHQRVLIIVENLPVPLDRRVWQEACALRDAGHEVTVICPQMRGYTEAEEVLEGIQIYRHRSRGEAKGICGFISRYATALWGEFRCARKAWQRKGFDVIHLCNPPDLLFLVALPFKLFAHVKVIFDVHGLWPEMYEAKFGRRGLLYQVVRFAERCTLALADVVIATNESVLAAVKQRGRKKDQDVFVVRTAPNQLNTLVAADLSLRKGRKHLVGYVGVMGNANGVNYLIEAAAHIVHRRRRNDVQFLLMGTGPEHAELAKLRDAMALQGFVDMPGRVTNEFLFTALKTMDLGVACNPINDYNDHYTMNKTLEYMAFSRAQVMFGTKEGRYSAGDAARYVTENSAEKLADAILEMIDNPEECERMGSLGYERLTRELSWKRSVASLLAAYDRACHRS
ncbi:glycosyltransferase family 4 protein [Roseimicrobium sp. ORNL1]|uniref:glycosyltransferase family 4 protein n=1 Tax=Roseimicrobium sp. ORNL1 TaxID=2711231 RepID=UPI0013E1E7AA|nr:glycosyltransferase family 4 protein [Roseimicrobium sp. ORNL1]QIF04098.1 glycosyltransferase family 4 protein [Roseimicrobium sp. ORNL1]